jgi:hypothetical protein
VDEMSIVIIEKKTVTIPQKQDRTEDAFREVARWKAQKCKGEIVLMFDGSGFVAKVKEVRYV